MAQVPKRKPIHKEKANAQVPQVAVKEEGEKPKKSGALSQLPTIQDMLEIPAEERADRANNYFDQVKPFLTKYMQKKLGSRVIQLIYKWGGDKVKNAIYKCALANWKDLVRSKFALYVLEKISKDLDLPGAVEDAVLLQSSWKGAQLLQQCANRSDEKMRSIKNKFYALWESSKQNDIKSQESLHNLAMKIIEKQYESLQISKLVLRLALPSMFDEQKQKALDYLITKVTEWVGDEEGVRLFLEVVNLSDHKMKKNIIKAFKGHIASIVELNNPTYVAVLKLLTEVDDTVYVEKNLLPEVEALIPMISTQKHAFSIIFGLFSPRLNNYNVLGKYEHQVSQTECKKSEQQRKQELRQHLYIPLLTYLSGTNLYQLLKHHINSRLIVALYKSMQEDNEVAMYKSFTSNVAQLFLDDAKDTIKQGSFPESLCADPCANKVLKLLLCQQNQSMDYFCDEFAKLMVKKMEYFVSNKAGFVLLGLIEKGGRDFLLNEVRKHRSRFGEAPAGKHFEALLAPRNKKTM